MGRATDDYRTKPTMFLVETHGKRSGVIVDAVAEVRLWRDGEVRVLERGEWRRDPLVTASFSGEFEPDVVEERDPTVRVIGARELSCRQLVFAAADTQTARPSPSRFFVTRGPRPIRSILLYTRI